MRRITKTLTAIFATAAALLTAAPAAFAFTVPSGGGGTSTASPVVHHSGSLGGWELGLIAVAAAVVLAAVVKSLSILTSRRSMAAQAAH